MNKITQTFFRRRENIFNTADVSVLLGGTRDSRNGLIKRAMKEKDIFRIRRGLYVLSPAFSEKPLSEFVIAQRIYGPSYVSLESALSHYGWIPEGVCATTCVSFGNAKSFDTPIGYFMYARIPQNCFYLGVNRVEDSSGVFLIASPEKALCDYVYEKRLQWSIDDAIESLRIDDEFVDGVKISALKQLSLNYNNMRVVRFLKTWINRLKGNSDEHRNN